MALPSARRFEAGRRTARERRDYYNKPQPSQRQDEEEAARGSAEGESEEEAPEGQAGEWFDPKLVYTFDFYTHVLDPQSMAALGFDVVPILAGQPVRPTKKFCHQ